MWLSLLNRRPSLPLLTVVTLLFTELVVGVPLTTVKNWKFTQKGLWLVKYQPGTTLTLSPYQLEKSDRTWKKLELAVSDWSEENQFYFGEVDCHTDGLLCPGGVGNLPIPSVYLLSEGVIQYQCPYLGEMKDLLTCLTRSIKEFQLHPLHLENQSSTSTEQDTLSILDAPVKDDYQSADSGSESEPEESLENDINVTGEVITLGEDNYSLTDTGPWFVKYYAPWCGHCKKLEPTWEILGETMKGIANIGRVDCTIHGEICKKMKVRGYPTLKLVQAGKSLEYRGGRSLEDLTQFVKDKFGKRSIQPVANITEMMVQDEVALVYYNPANKPVESTLSEILSDLDIQIPVYEVRDYWINHLSYNIKNRPSLLLIKDGIIREYPGSLSNSSQVLEWVLVEQYPIVRTVTIRDLLEAFGKETGLAVLKLVVDPLPKERKQFRDLAEPLLRRESGEILFGVVDAVAFPKVTRLFGIKSHHLPAIIIYDLKTKLQYTKNQDGSLIALNYDAIRHALLAYHRGELQGHPLDTTRKIFTYDNLVAFTLYLILPILLALTLIYLLVTYLGDSDVEDEGDGREVREPLLRPTTTGTPILDTTKLEN